MVKISTERVLDESWEIFKKNWLGLSVFVLVFFIVDSAISKLGPQPDTDEISGILSGGLNADSLQQLLASYKGSPLISVLSTLLSCIFTIVMMNLCLGLIRNKIPSASVSTVIDAFKINLDTYVRAILASILQGIIVVIGLCCCIVPGIYLALRLQFVAAVILDNPKISIIDSLKASWKLTEGNVGNLFLLAVVLLVIIIFGIICCCVGLIPASAFTELTGPVAYCILCRGMAPMDDPKVNVEEVTPTPMEQGQQQ